MRTIACSASKRNSASARASSVLPTPVGPRNMNEPMRPVRVLQAGAGAADGVADGADRLLLPDDALGQPLLHLQQPLALAFEHPADGDVRPRADHLRDVLRVHLLLEHALVLLEFGEARVLLCDFLLKRRG